MSDSNSTVEVTEAYYDSKDADEFYRRVWGGEDIHVGLYDPPDISIYDASRQTVERMCAKLPDLSAETRVLDLGAGYGGAARYLVERYGCRVTCLNLSEAQNEYNRERNKAAGLASRIEVVHGNFEEIPAPTGTYDLVWSQDSILHSGRRRKVLSEVHRVLVPGGELIFTDPMQRDDCDPSTLTAVYERIHLDSLGSPGWYQKTAEELGFETLGFDELTPHLRSHYARVRQDLLDRYDEIIGYSSREYVDRMIKGLEHWVNAADQGSLVWGILHFRRR